MMRSTIHGRPASATPIVWAFVALLAAALVAPGTAAGGPVTPSGRLPPDTDYRDKGMRAEVLAFLKPTHFDWALERMDYRAVSTLAYFAVAADRYGRLVRRTPSGSIAVGWAGWTSPKLSTLIARAHAARTRVVLTVQRFGWDAAGRRETSALLGSSTARQRLANELAAAVVARGVDGANVDVEPVPSGHRANFVDLVRRVRRALDARGPGYQLTVDSTGYIANYDVAGLTAPGAADAIYIMGYQYRGAITSRVGSTAPLGGPRYDVRDTLDAYQALTAPGKIILGVPYYGYTWPTASGQLNAAPTGAGRTVTFDRGMEALARYGRRYDRVEQVAWTAWRERTCPTCPEGWRQLYLDDPRALRAKYDLALARGLRGGGIWALGYEGPRSGPFTVLRERFLIAP